MQFNAVNRHKTLFTLGQQQAIFFMSRSRSPSVNLIRLKSSHEAIDLIGSGL
jgi:hypothetical protein